MSRRLRNPSPTTIALLLLAAGGVGYWYFTREAKAKGPTKPASTEQLYRGWKITVEPDYDVNVRPWHWLARPPEGSDPELVVIEGNADSVSEAVDNAKAEIDRWES